MERKRSELDRLHLLADIEHLKEGLKDRRWRADAEFDTTHHERRCRCCLCERDKREEGY
jgi:hypothetical protein